MSNLSAIGFAATSEDEFERTVDAALGRAVSRAALGPLADKYLWFRDPSGAALAARLSPRNTIACITPFFAAPDGGTRWRVQTSASLIDQECLHCSGADCDVLDPSSGTMCTRTALQFLFFEPYRAWLGQARTFDVVIVGFASTLTLCATPDDLERAQARLFGKAEPGVPRTAGKPMRLATEAFLPHGMFGDNRTLGARARAYLTGSVESATFLRNELTGCKFVHTRARTLGGAIDIVAPADGVEIPKKPKLVIANCWLVGRPIEAPPGKRGLLGRLFGRS